MGSTLLRAFAAVDGYEDAHNARCYYAFGEGKWLIKSRGMADATPEAVNKGTRGDVVAQQIVTPGRTEQRPDEKPEGSPAPAAPFRPTGTAEKIELLGFPACGIK